MKKQIKKFSESLNESDSLINRKLLLYKNVLSLFVDKMPDDNILINYLTIEDAHIELQDFINLNLKKEIYWSTAIGIIDACDLILEEAISNGNINKDYKINI